MKASILTLFLLLSFNLAAQKNAKDFELLQGIWPAEEDKRSIVVIKKDTMYSLYLGSSYYSKNMFSLENEALYKDQKVKAKEGEKFLIMHDNNGIESLYYLLGLDNRILSLMNYDTGQIVVYNKSKKKIDLPSLPK